MNVRRNLIALCLGLGTLGATVAMPAAADVWVSIGPPAPRYEVVPVLEPGWVWAPGYWAWNGHRYHWVSGHRIRAQHNAHYVPHRWVHDHGRWRLENGHWDHRVANSRGDDRYHSRWDDRGYYGRYDDRQ